MSFLAPLFLAGAVAVALPILFHLIRKTTNEKTIFSSLMFLLPTPPKVTRRSRLDNILLLALRCAVLGLLALGFARPYLVRPSEGGAAAGAGKKVVVLVDTSASMRRENLWPEARERVKDVLARMGPADEAAVMAFNDQTSELVSLEEWRRTPVADRKAIAIARVEGLGPTWRGTHLGNALVTAMEALEEVARSRSDRDPETVREIVVISDLQQGSRLEGLQGMEWPKGLTVRVEALKARRPSNAGVHLLGEREDAGPSAELNRRVWIVNSSDAKREQFRLGAIEAYVPPGQSRILQLPPLPDGQQFGQFTLTGDEEDFDNRLYWVSTKQAQVNVVYLGTEPENDTTQPLFYLKRAFQQTARQAVQVTNRMDTGAALGIISDAMPEARGDARPPTMMVVLKSAAGVKVVSQLLDLPQLSCEEAAGQKYSLLGEIDFTHPLFRPFADPRFSDFTKIHFWKHRRLDAQQIPGARVLARFDDGDPALIEVPRDTGRVLILTSGWHPADSQLALSSKFVPLLYSLLESSSADRALNVQFEIGQTLSLPVKTTTVRKADGAEVPWDQATDAPGIYSVSNLNFAVNLAAAESRTAPMAIDELEQLGVPVKMSSPKIVAEQKRTAQRFQAAEAENQQKLWRWLIVGALGLLLAETLLAGRLTRLTSGISPSPP